MNRIADLSRILAHEMDVFPGARRPNLIQSARIENQGFVDHHLSTGMHVSTHMDGPMHMMPNGKALYEYTAERFINTAICINAVGQMNLQSDLLNDLEPEAYGAILFRTAHDEHWGKSSYYQDYPILSEELALRLVELKPKLIGLDWPSPDKSPFSIHPILLGNDILIIENLCGLDQLPLNASFELFSLPLLIQADSAPCRVIARW